MKPQLMQPCKRPFRPATLPLSWKHSPRHLQNRAHGHAQRAARQRVRARGVKQHRIEAKRRGRAEDGAYVGDVHQPLQHRHALGAFQHLVNRAWPRTTKRPHHAACHLEPHKLTHHLARGKKHRHRRVDALHQRQHRLRVALVKQQRKRLIPLAQGNLQGKRRLDHHHRPLGLQGVPQLVVGQPRVHVKALVGKICNVNGRHALPSLAQTSLHVRYHSVTTAASHTRDRTITQPRHEQRGSS